MCQNHYLIYCCLRAIAGLLAFITRCLVFMQEVINIVWYRFALHTAEKVGAWPNYTTGRLILLPEVRYNVRRGRIERIESQIFHFDHTGRGYQQTAV